MAVLSVCRARKQLAHTTVVIVDLKIKIKKKLNCEACCRVLRMKRFSLFIIILILSFNVRDSTTIHQFQFFFPSHTYMCLVFGGCCVSNAPRNRSICFFVKRESHVGSESSRIRKKKSVAKKQLRRAILMMFPRFEIHTVGLLHTNYNEQIRTCGR